MAELENIDDEADKCGKFRFLFLFGKVSYKRSIAGIDFVKINDDEAAKKYGIINTPALIYFRKRTPMVYDGIEPKNSNYENTNCHSIFLKVIYWMSNGC